MLCNHIFTHTKQVNCVRSHISLCSIIYSLHYVIRHGMFLLSSCFHRAQSIIIVLSSRFRSCFHSILSNPYIFLPLLTNLFTCTNVLITCCKKCTLLLGRSNKVEEYIEYFLASMTGVQLCHSSSTIENCQQR